LAPYGPDMRDQNHPSVVLPLGYEPSEYIWCTLSGTRNSVDEVEKRGKKSLPRPIFHSLSHWMDYPVIWYQPHSTNYKKN